MHPRIEPVVDNLRQQRANFERFARSLDAAELACPVPGTAWTVTDFVAHVVTLDGAYAGWFRDLAGEPAGAAHRGSDGFDVDAYNEAEVAACRQLTLDAILAEGAHRREAVIGALSLLEDSHLDATIRFGGDRKRPARTLPLADFLQGWPRHDAIHAADMLKALPGRREDPDLKRWLGDPAIAASIAAYQQAMG